jgi:hypothetical protein
MTRLLSGSTLRRGGSGQFIDLQGAMPQLPASETTATGFTIVTDSLLRTTYRSSLGYIEFTSATMFSSLPEGTIRVRATGSTFLSVSTTTGNLVVQGGVGVGGNMHIAKDIVVNGLTIGKGFEGINNIVIQGVAQPESTEENEGQASIAIGYDALQGLTTSYKNIAIGRYALHSGTNLTNNIAIGDSALKKIGFIYAIPILSVVDASQTSPIVIITDGPHNLSTGTNVSFSNMEGMPDLNGQSFYIKKLSNDTLSLYYDLILSNPVDGTEFDVYNPGGGGTLDRILLKNNNIAIGTDSGKNLYDGEKNFFFGDGVGTNLTTGSNNFFIGHSVGNNIVYGNNNIALGGDNLVDGLNDQVNIGSVFYYNGMGDLQLNADTEVGLGTPATITPAGNIVSTSTYTGGLIVIGGLIVTENSILNKDVRILSSTLSTSATSGALVISGGVGIGGNLHVGNQLNVIGPGDINLSPQGANVYIQPELSGTIIINPSLNPGTLDNIDIGNTVPRNGNFLTLTATTKVNVLSTVNSISTTTGALVIDGGVGIGKDLWLGGNLYGPNILGLNGQVVYVNTSVADTYYLGLTKFIGTYSNVSSTSTFSFDGTSNQLTVPLINISSTLSSTITNIQQSLAVNGGAYVEKGIYSAISGNSYENNLVYTPTVTVSTTTPLSPRVGDFWIDSNNGVELQYIQDGSNRLWIQFAVL